jgi:hypothetical protein
VDDGELSVPFVDDDLPSDCARVLRELRDDLGPDVIPIGTIPAEILEYWPEAVTQKVIVTRERRRHYLDRHPEIVRDEPRLFAALAHPSEVHRNKLDARIAIVYFRIDSDFYLRIPIWVSDRIDRQNSVLSLRRARVREVESGRAARRQVWRRMR